MFKSVDLAPGIYIELIWTIFHLALVTIFTIRSASSITREVNRLVIQIAFKFTKTNHFILILGPKNVNVNSPNSQPVSRC